MYNRTNNKKINSVKHSKTEENVAVLYNSLAAGKKQKPKDESKEAIKLRENPIHKSPKTVEESSSSKFLVFVTKHETPCSCS